MIIYISLQGLLVKGLRRRPLTAKTGVRFSYKLLLRGVAQFGRALRSGRRGRKFKSCRIDSLAGAPETLNLQCFRFFFYFLKFVRKFRSKDRSKNVLKFDDKTGKGYEYKSLQNIRTGSQTFPNCRFFFYFSSSTAFSASFVTIPSTTM